MQTINSFPHLIDNIIGELEMVSQVRIDCLSTEEKSSSSSDVALRVTAVNGMETSWEYMNLLRDIKTEVLGRYREVIPYVPPRQLDSFIDMSLRRMRQLKRSVVVTAYEVKGKGPYIDACWAFDVMQCFLDDVESDDYRVYLEAMQQTRRQAWIFHLELKRLEDRISCFAGAIIDPAVHSSCGHSFQPVQKIRLNCTVPFLGALIRVACDRNLIERPNVAELCRHLSVNYATVRQENISAHSLRNHMDNPNPNVLEEVKQEIQIWERYLSKFILQQQR
jgi:hypothetical protein